MDARLMLIAASALGFASTATAEPTKSAAPAAPPAKERAVVLASAEVPAATVAASNPNTAPAVPGRKPRAARVATCRCADTPNP